MLISLNWIREFVDLPSDLSPKELADRFTLICAEVEDVTPIEVCADGLICAEITKLDAVEGRSDVRAAVMDIGGGKTVETVTAAPDLNVGDRVVFAPSGASVKALGAIKDSTVAGLKSSGMILPGDAVGIDMAAREAIFLPPSVQPGQPLESEVFDDWVIEVDNHSINHRPDLWGHYGIAREFAAIFGSPLKPYAVAELEELSDASLPEIPIEIDDADACPRYSGLRLKGLTNQPAPLWMQLRLGHVGLRPIDCLVDLTNYIMFELGQPMHAFDGDKVERIGVRAADAGTKFVTLDNVERTLPGGALMITTNGCEPIALAGIMGGAETEISEGTRTMLLESANFHPYVIRRCATHLGHRTDASARFEKSLDPNHTVLAIQRFVHLAAEEFADFALDSRLSDAYAKRLPDISVTIDPKFVARFMGHPVSREQITDILTRLEFKVSDAGEKLKVDVPSFRATRDIEIEADIIEEVARYVGYNNIEPGFPEVVVRALDSNPLQRIEREGLRAMVMSFGMTEVQDYIWYNSEWCNRLGYDPQNCLTLRNPAAAGMERLRQSLMPGMLSFGSQNRHHFSEFRMVQLGSAFPVDDPKICETRRLALLCGLRDKSAEDALLAELKGVIENWSWQVLDRPADFAAADANPARPWEHEHKTASIRIAGNAVGRVSAIPLALRQRMDEHLAAWSLVWAEFDLDPLANLGEHVEKLPPVPAFPEVDLDFSILVDASRRYTDVTETLSQFDDAILNRITFIESYEGKSVAAGKRALTLRARVGHKEKTLEESDLARFHESITTYLNGCNMELRGT